MSENSWFYWLSDPPWSLQLDIVGFLAILGEASVLANSQVANLSKTCFLPRLIPAPQALIRTSRPERLHPATGVVVGAHSGNIRRHVNHIPHILHQVAFHKWKLGSSEPQEYQVRAIEVKWANHIRDDEKDVKYAAQKAADRSKARSGRGNRAKRRSWGPLIFLAYIGCLMSISLLIMSLVRRDGMSLVAVILLSLCSSLVGLGSHWDLKLPERTEMRNDIPPSDVIISYPNGSFLVVRCVEEIARLYFQSEQCEYYVKSRWQYRTIALFASMMLMIGVICLANATPLLQILWAAQYIILNALYWIVAALPARWHWDMSSFDHLYQEFEWVAFDKTKHPDGSVSYDERLLKGWEKSKNPTFTEALWKTIALTRNSHWARVGEIAPATGGWDAWLRAAMHQGRELTSPVEPGQDHFSIAHSIAGSESDGKGEKGKSSAIDPESQINIRSRKINEKPKPTLALPRWNYSEELTICLKKHNRETW